MNKKYGFNFNDMGDDNFMKKFMQFLLDQSHGLKDFMKNSYLDPIDGDINPFLDFENIKNGFTPSSGDKVDVERGSDTHGEWEKRSWSSSDGTLYVTSFTREFNTKKNKEDDMPSDEATLDILNKKLNKCIQDERYEDAAKIRDLIKSIEGS